MHRLDKDTSGVMVVAKTQLANDALTAAFAARDLDRTYLALVWGLPSPLKGEIEGAIGRDKRDRKRMAVVTMDGKPALTHYRTLRSWQTASRCWNAGWPPAGPTKFAFTLPAEAIPLSATPSTYGAFRRSPDLCRHPSVSRLLDFPRQALHAARLGFVHPRTGMPLSFSSRPAARYGGNLAALDRDLRAAQG